MNFDQLCNQIVEPSENDKKMFANNLPVLNQALSRKRMKSNPNLLKRIEAVDDDILRTIAYKTNKFLEFTKLNQKLKIRHCGSHQLDELFSSKFNQSI